ncbi:MAG: hypothetical protein N3F03_04795 [Ignavibacteria bacterium]|nr:hypothetical protein [Ignavibacteria bacterium]
MKKLLFTLLVLSSYLFSQVYNFHYYNSSNGLTNTSVTCLAQDSKGYIWIGTTSNVFRYDGYRFEEISLWNNELRTEITGIVELNNEIWIATSNKGIFIVKHDKKVVSLKSRASNIPDKIKLIRKKDGRVLFISSANEFYQAYSDTQVSKILVDALLPQTQFNDIVPIEGGYAIASDEGLIIFQYNRVKYKFNQSKNNKELKVKALALDKNQNIIFLNFNGSICKVENFNVVEIFNSNKVYSKFSLLVDNTNSVWAGYDDGILRIENNKETFIGFANGLPHQVVTTLFEDREGNIWIGTLNGIAKLNSLAIKNYPSLFPKVTSSIYKIHISSGNVNVFSNEGISVFNITNHNIINFSFNFSNQNNVNDVVDVKNTKLIGSNNGLYIWQGNKLLLSPLNSQLNSKRILSLAKSSEEKIFVGTDSGLFVFQGNRLVDYLSVDNVLPSNEIHSILVSRSGEIWIGTENGLVKYADENFLVLRTGNGLANNFVTSLSEDKDGRIWIGTKKGISSFKNGRFNNFYPKIDGYNVDEILDVIPVRADEIWAATSRGIFIIKNGVEFSSLTSSDGLLSDYVTDLEYDSQSGIVYIGTNSGLTTIELKYLKENKFTYKIYFTGFSTEKKNYELNQLKISEDENEIKIRVSIFSFFDEKKIIYKYRIKELEDSWNYLTNSNEIKYKDLPAGKYTLIVQASTNGIDWLPNSAELTFEVKSGLFGNLILYGSILIGLVFLVTILIYFKGSLRLPRRLHEKIFKTEKDISETYEQISEINKTYEQNTSKDDLVTIQKRLEEKIESLTSILLEKEKLIEQMKNENLSLREKIHELEIQLNSRVEQIENEKEETEFVEKSKIEIIVKNSSEAEEIKRYIEALEQTNWNIRAAAKLLNIPHSTFHYRLKKLNLLKNK